MNFKDFAILAAQWLQAPGIPSADIAPPGGDGDVNPLDRAVILEEWLTTPPSQATDPEPADEAISVNIMADLSWKAGPDVTSYDVYFGTSSPGTFRGNQTVATYDPGIMATLTTYYWRIDTVNSYGKTIGEVWRFATFMPPP